MLDVVKALVNIQICLNTLEKGEKPTLSPVGTGKIAMVRCTSFFEKKNKSSNSTLERTSKKGPEES